MKFWIVTPSYNQLDWIKTCIASVADQYLLEDNSLNKIEVHHHIQDASSSDGTPKWLEQYSNDLIQKKVQGYSFSYESKKDEGMYDALNTGWKKAPPDTDIIAHLNCDEQYLPHALERVAHFFKNNKKVEVLLTDMIIVTKTDTYVCHRRSVFPIPLLSRLYCAGMTASTFHRAHITQTKNIYFDTQWKMVGDMVWYNALHDAKIKFATLNIFTSSFAESGENLMRSDAGAEELKRYRKQYLHGTKLNLLGRKIQTLRMFFLNFFLPTPLTVEIYKKGNSLRSQIKITHPTIFWGNPLSKLFKQKNNIFSN